MKSYLLGALRYHRKSSEANHYTFYALEYHEDQQTEEEAGKKEFVVKAVIKPLIQMEVGEDYSKISKNSGTGLVFSCFINPNTKIIHFGTSGIHLEKDHIMSRSFEMILNQLLLMLKKRFSKYSIAPFVIKYNHIATDEIIQKIKQSLNHNNIMFEFCFKTSLSLTTKMTKLANIHAYHYGGEHTYLESVQALLEFTKLCSHQMNMHHQLLQRNRFLENAARRINAEHSATKVACIALFFLCLALFSFTLTT